MASSSSSLPLSSTDHQNHYTFEVFLSFRGEDTRFGFTDHLYKALLQRGIETFRDAENPNRGEYIPVALLKAIEESRVSIVVFSQNYASSRWCLDELVKILECRKSKGQVVRSVFYKVDPSDVRKQTGAFGDAFAKIDQCKYKDSIAKWRKALEEAANLSGWPFKDGEYESNFIDRIVEELSTQVINPSYDLDVAEHPIGLVSCRQDVIRLLHAKENNMVCIWGPGGIGKTTIAKDVFNTIRSKFEGSCFLAEVRSNGLAQLQERLLSCILRDPTLKVSCVDQGVSFIKERMWGKKVFLVLDDVSDSSQLQKLVPSPDCFGPGSRILITTRDKGLTARADGVYEVKFLNDDQALELFSFHAFKSNGPPSDYLELAQRAVRYAEGLPLALIVLGYRLFGRSRDEWEATLGSHIEISDGQSKQKMTSRINAAASSSSSSFPHSSSDHQNHYTYDVFLSFRGEDMHSNFTDNLHSLLCDRGIETFIDDELKRGEEISAVLVKAIEESRVSIIVFSQNYASSRWCLDELVKILECRKSKGQEVRVVFYNVDPSDVRHQRGAFGDAFATLDQCKYKDSMDKWKAALKEAADLSRWTYEEEWYETEFINDIVEELSTRVVNPSCKLPVAEHPIGLQSYRQDVIRLLDAEENNMVGIWGPGGIGKTTIAKDVFKSIRHKFDGSCFLTDFRSRGLAKLQEILLSCILRDSTLKVSNVDQGVSFIKTRMRHKKVLLILDDVSDSSQLQKLVPSPDCFGPGSRILITTRDKGLTARADGVYEVKFLNDDQALELFSFHAFRSNGPPSDCLELAQRAVRYAEGLPLALIVLGSHLFGRSRDEWEATLDSCKGEDPHREIRNVLKISYDALGVDLKGYFLDIACFFKGEHVDRVKPILEACYDLNSVTGIAQLQQKALIRIDNETLMGGRIWMHDLIEEMGKDIVYQESPDEPGERSRLWSEKDVSHVLTNNTGTNKVIGIQLLWLSSTISLNAKSFSGMKKLRYISMSRMMKYESFSRDIDYLSDQLRWLDWPECPLPCFPSDFHAKKLVNLDISESRGITRLWEGHKNFSRLTCMNLRGCTSLKELPDFSGMPNLKELDIFECTSLVEVPDSIRFLHNLVTLNVRCCSNLILFPRKVNLRSVKAISVSYCKLEEFSEVGEEMSFLTSLDLPGTCIKELHPSITNLIGLEELILGDSQNLTVLPYNIYELRNLKSLDAHNCPKLARFPEIPIEMDSLRELDLRGSGIRELDKSIGNLTRLQLLDLSDCKNLTTIPCSIYGLQNLQDLTLINCSKLVRYPTNTNILNVDGCSLSLPKLQIFNIGGCSLSDCDFLMTLDCWETLEYLDLSYNNFVSLPACFTKFVNLRWLDLRDCKRLREIPELPPNVDPDISGCELLEERFSTWLSLSSETPKRHRSAEEPSPAAAETTPVNPPKRQRTAAGGQASLNDSSTASTPRGTN